MWFLFFTGFVSLAAQVVLLRELSVTFYGVELVYTLAIGAWLFWTAVGAALDWGRERPPSVEAIGALLAASGVLTVAGALFARAARQLMGGTPGAYLPVGQQFVTLIVVLLPVGVTLGLLFQWAARRIVAHGRSLALAYAVESAGALVGGVLGAELVRLGLPTSALAAICAAASGMGALAVVRRRAVWTWVVPAVPLVLGCGVLANIDRVDRTTTAWAHPFLVEVRDSAYGRLAVTATGGQVTFFENDALIFESASIDPEVFVHLVVLQHAGPRRALVLGGYVEGLHDLVRAHGVDEVDVVDLDEARIDLADRYLPARMVSAHGRVRLRLGDPRQSVRQPGVYDLVIVGMPEPTSAQANRFYTREFFGDCAARLGASGVLGLRLHTAENFWTPAQVQRVRSIEISLRAHFGHVLVVPGTPTVLLASNGALTAEPAPLVERLEARAVASRLVTPSFIRYVMTNDRLAAARRDLSAAGATPPNTDARPVSFRYALVLWLGQFWPTVAAADLAKLRIPQWLRWPSWMLASGLLAACFVLARRRAVVRRALLVGTIALSAMLIEVAALLYYQVTNGVIYRDLGLLLTAFMAGLAVGAMMLARASVAPSTWSGFSVVAVLATAGVALGAMVSAGTDVGLTTAATLIGVTGASVGAVFGYVSRSGAPDQRRVIAPLYASDLAGGCLGAVAGGLLLVPLLGLDSTAFAGAWLALLALMLL